MNNEPRQKLCELIAEYGRSLCNDPTRCEALLRDYCGIHKREIFVLVSALKQKVTDDILKSSAGVPQEIVIERLCKRLEDELAMTAEAARWAVESWALALGFVTVSSLTVKPLVQPTPHTAASNVKRKLTLAEATWVRNAVQVRKGGLNPQATLPLSTSGTPGLDDDKYTNTRVKRVFFIKNPLTRLLK